MTILGPAGPEVFVISFERGTRMFTAAFLTDADLRVEVNIRVTGAIAATAIPRVTDHVQSYADSF